MLNIDRKSIATKLTITMLVIILLQSIFLIGSVFVSGAVSNTKMDAYKSFERTVENRKDYLNNEMVYRWSNIISFSSEVNELYMDMHSSGEVSDDQSKQDQFLNQATPSLISMMRATMSTGVFIILDDNKAKGTPHSGIYLKDYDPVLNNDFNKDLCMLKGPNNVGRDYQIPLDSNWNYGIDLSESQKDMFYQPYNAAKAGVSADHLGFWHISESMGSNKVEVLTYTLPLVDENGDPYGVIGVEISQDYLFTHLPKEELSDSTLADYIIGVYDDNIKNITPKIIQGSVYAPIASIDKPLNLNPISEYEGIYKTEKKDFKFDVISYPSELKLYNENTYFSDQHFALIGMIDQENLLSFSNEFVSNLLISTIISLFIGAFIVFLSAISFVKPILTLADEVRLNDPQDIGSFSKTGLSEIDELSAAIETLNRNILEKSFKTDKIINMANLPLGTFETYDVEDHVMCSPVVISLLNLENSVIKNNNVSKDDFLKTIETIKKNPEPDEQDIYLLSSNPNQWIKIVSIKIDNGVLGVVMDVTRDVLEHNSIRFERDYDVLTGIFNRSAFKREVQNLFLGNLESTAAFLMFDLDNLKYINDTYGHETGDLYIKEVALVLSTFFQKNSVVGRMSGDEFFVFIYNQESKEKVYAYLKEFYVELEYNKMILPNGNEFKMRVSGGLAWYGEHSVSFDELTRYADFAMYEGKHTVKGEIREFNKENYEKGSFMLSGSEELNKILDNQLVEFAFQPIISAKTGELYAYESLMRPQSEILSTPIKLLKLATSQSRLWQVEKITFFKTLSTYKKYEDLFKGCKIFINSIPNEILKEEEYKMLERDYGDILDKIVIEIIENEKLDERTLNIKKELVKSWGGALALDDYGAGYNGEISMLSMSPQIVKIDKTMIDGIDSDKNRQSIVEKLLLYTKEQNIMTLAEGVETKEQLKYLINIGIDLLQGYYIGKPEFKPEFNNVKIAKEIKKFTRIRS